MSFSQLPDLDFLNNRLFYDPDTGIFRWREVGVEFFATKNSWSSWNSRFSGKTAGKLRDDGYLSVRLKYLNTSKTYLLHRVALKMFYGKDPEGFVDHINGNRQDNRIENLRVVSRSENQRNQKKRTNNTTGVLGVSWSKHANAWLARITYDGKQKNLGYYKDFDDAVRVRMAAEIKHNYHKNHGRD